MGNDRIKKVLNNTLQGEVRFDDISRTIYSSDASIYELRPLGVVIPKNAEDIRKTILAAAEENIPLIPRGAATGITGGCLGSGIIIDCSKYLNSILHIDPEKQTALCEPGVIQDTLNEAVSPYGLRLGPDTSTGNRATIGGMFANNAAGARSLRYSYMANHVLATELLLSNGETLSFDNVSIEEWNKLCQGSDTKASLYATCKQLREQLSSEINLRFTPMPRRVSGYNFPSLLHPDNFNLCQLLAGSEGTLGITTQITVKLSPKPENQKLCLISFDSLENAFEEVTSLLELKPLALELIDKDIITAGKSSPALQSELSWLVEIPAALLVLEFDGPTSSEMVRQTAAKFPSRSLIIEDIATMKSVWNLRKAGLGLLMSKRSYARAIAFLEDVSVPPQELAPFMRSFLALLGSADKRAGIYGHAGAGCMHIRPYMDLRSSEDRRTIESLMLATTQLLLKHHGSLSGEHGDGLIRSWLNEALYGKKIYQGFRTLKNAFDPHHLMNPNKIVDGPPLFQNIRKSPIKTPSTFLDFSKEGGFDLSVDMCNGNGLCRKKEGTMCPSFQATGDEKDSTRARAVMLHSMISNPQNDKDIGSQEVHDILDLCLSCKGCKTECPSQVDMAKLKAEAQHHYRQKHGLDLRSKLIGHLGYYFSWGSVFSSLANNFNKSSFGKYCLSLLGFSKSRSLPALAAQTFDSWIQKNHQASNQPSILLFNDTFTNFNNPEIGIAAYKLLTSLGYNVIVPPWKCCGRTTLSKGMLPEARKYAEALLNSLQNYPYLPLVFLEPSCWSAFKDDYKSLLPLAISNPIFLLEEFLLEPNTLKTLQKASKLIKRHDVAIHVHCHQKSLSGVGAAHTLLNLIPGITAKIIPTGCCGMAGAFGYESEHYEISQWIGELVLLPTIRKMPDCTYIISNGTSCRAQIVEGTKRPALHLAEYLNGILF
ncbi:MAG: FAD-linked oxidase C-terminal domain-containing protein [Parachlamydiales bacterium]|jgi:FAD/FMN-containing dehydrogenase/Fe-S oxidoreductase